MKKMIFTSLLFLMIAAAPGYAADAGHFEIVEGTVNTIITDGQLAQIKRTFLLNTQTGESFIFADGKWFLMEKVNSFVDTDGPKLKKAAKETEE